MFYLDCYSAYHENNNRICYFLPNNLKKDMYMNFLTFE